MEPISFTQALASGQRLTSLRRVYLQRLERLQRLRRQHEQELNGQGIRLLNRSVFAAYCACRDAGAEDEAREILGEGVCGLTEDHGRFAMAHPEQSQPPAA